MIRRRSLDPNPLALPMCFYGDPVLREPAKDIPTITRDIIELAERMVVTMRDEDGIGLAAPQVGQSLNMITIEIFPSDPADEVASPIPVVLTPGEMRLLPLMPLVLLNPRLSQPSEQQSPYLEGCLSIPGLAAPVLRPDYVHLDAQLLSGEAISLRCGGLLARVLQHEVDHLNGVLFVDLISDEDYAELEPKLKKMSQETLKTLNKRKRR